MNLTQASVKKYKDKLDDPDMIHEDYAYVLDELHDKGIKKVLCDVWCDECDKEFEAKVNTDTFEWTCPQCGIVSDQG